MKLRDYQIDLIDDTRESFRRFNKPLVVLPCG
jgi:superfamily II DNA or RNA helicase